MANFLFHNIAKGIQKMRTVISKNLAGRSHDHLLNNNRLRSDLNNAKLLVRGPASLSLRKLWAPYEPRQRRTAKPRGYYVLYTRYGQVYYRRFRLTELSLAHHYFLHIKNRRLTD